MHDRLLPTYQACTVNFVNSIMNMRSKIMKHVFNKSKSKIFIRIKYKIIGETDVQNVLINPQKSYTNSNIFSNNLYGKYNTRNSHTLTPLTCRLPKRESIG